ncbi:MMPL family transporter [Methylophaga sp.]|uniref:MMPL family transporter n=1 Tax=Methylophaga sp. TaxID=2024840 RepID=UPI0025D85022|nr:MMPL family transporter [Methylophaga sp.]
MASKVAATLWVLLVLSLLFLAWLKQPVIDTSMMSLLPESQQQPLVREASAQMGQRFAERLLILISGQGKQQLQQATQTLAGRFQQIPEVESVLWQIDEQQIAQSQQASDDYRYVLLSEKIRSALQNDNTDIVAKRALSMIYSPMQVGGQNLKADPFALSSAWRTAQTPVINIEMDEQGYLRVPNEQALTNLVIIQLKGDAFSINVQQAVLSVFDELRSSLSEQDIELLPSGLLIHADAGAQQAEKEISTIGLGSIAGILILMLWVFRSLRLVTILLLPIAVGCAVATSVALLVFERVHIVTFAFGAGLIGVAIDYALHFMCERQRHQQVLPRIMPGLLLGLFSSVLAYAAQAMSPFPGLRQMAVFSAVGLVAAWLTVVIWLPRLTQKDPLAELPLAKQLTKWQSACPPMAANKKFQFVLGIIVIAAITSIWSGKTEDDIRLLQTSPATLLEQETNVQTRLGLNSSTQFLLISCDQLDQCLQQEEAIRPWLSQQVDNGVLLNFSLLADRLPSLARQQSNAGLVEKLYQAELSDLFAALKLSDTAYRQTMEMMHQGLANRLTLQQLPNKDFAGMLSSQIIQTEQNGLATIISLTASQPKQLAEQLNLNEYFPTVMLIDQVEAISSLMADYRQQIMIWVALAYLFVFVILFMRYKIAAWRIILPPMLASLFTLGILMQCLPGINLFHFMALILVLGIGLDMGIFLTETQQAANTWLAVTLSVITSLLAFGLLALSQTPVLQHFGLTVFLGLAMIWILTTLLRQPSQGVE